MKTFFLYINLILIFLSTNLNAENSIIYGENEDYAGKELTFFVYEDLISKNTKDIFTVKVNSEGKFRKEFEISSQKPIFCLTGIYKIWFIAKPGVKYKIALPDFVAQTKAEKYNPYFKPIYLMAGVISEDKNDPNNLINDFQYDFRTIVDDNIIEFMTEKKKSDVHKFIDSLKNKYPQNNTDYFTSWKKFRFAKLRRIAYERNHRYVINKYFRKDKVHYQNPAYMELFLDLFRDYFGHFLLRPDGKELLEAVNKYKSPSQISKVLSRMFELDNMPLREYVIIKGLKDAYYLDDFRKKSILICLDSIALKSEFPEHKITAKNVINELTHLSLGTKIPELKLQNIKGKTIPIEKMNNQITYLSFIHTELIPCRKQLGKLSEMAKEYHKDFKIWLVIMDENKEKALENLENYDNKFWKITLPAENSLISKKWKIKGYPAYFLIGPDKKFIFSPAAAPTEKFEQQFFEYTKR